MNDHSFLSACIDLLFHIRSGQFDRLHGGKVEISAFSGCFPPLVHIVDSPLFHILLKMRKNAVCPLFISNFSPHLFHFHRCGKEWFSTFPQFCFSTVHFFPSLSTWINVEKVENPCIYPNLSFSHCGKLLRTLFRSQS